jgi:hypothetical protein
MFFKIPINALSCISGNLAGKLKMRERILLSIQAGIGQSGHRKKWVDGVLE